VTRVEPAGLGLARRSLLGISRNQLSRRTFSSAGQKVQPQNETVFAHAFTPALTSFLP
jgi:hypothetical protein